MIKKNPNVIIFSSPPFGQRVQKIYGVHRIASEIRKHGFTCQIIHYFVFLSKKEIEAILRKLMGRKTIVIGFSVTFWSWTDFRDESNTINLANYIISYSKKINPNVKFIGGGPDILELVGGIKGQRAFKRKATLGIDTVFEGFPEKILVEYLKALKNKKNLPTPNNISDQGTYIYNAKDDEFDFNHSKIEYVDEDLLIPGETSVIETARGCIFKCKFCSFRLNGKSKFDYIKDSETIREELIDNYEKYKLQYYILSDDTFNDSTYKIESLHKVFTSLPFKIKFSTYLRLDLLYHNRQQIDLLHEMGLTGAMFGVETFHEAAARSIGKGISGDRSKELLYDLKHKHWKNDVKIEVALITGLPFETYKSYDETKKWIEDPDNLIETVRVNALGLQNSLIYNGSDASMNGFSKEVSKYGFYFPDPKSHSWKKLDGDIRSFEQADEVRKDLEAVAKNNFRRFQGGFGLFSFWPKILAAGIDCSFEDLINMDRFEYEDFVQRIIDQDLNKIIIEKYKNNFLKSNGR
jgi:hypothetical protein